MFRPIPVAHTNPTSQSSGGRDDNGGGRHATKGVSVSCERVPELVDWRPLSDGLVASVSASIEGEMVMSDQHSSPRRHFGPARQDHAEEGALTTQTEKLLNGDELKQVLVNDCNVDSGDKEEANNEALDSPNGISHRVRPDETGSQVRWGLERLANILRNDCLCKLMWALSAWYRILLDPRAETGDVAIRNALERPSRGMDILHGLLESWRETNLMCALALWYRLIVRAPPEVNDIDGDTIDDSIRVKERQDASTKERAEALGTMSPRQYEAAEATLDAASVMKCAEDREAEGKNSQRMVAEELVESLLGDATIESDKTRLLLHEIQALQGFNPLSGSSSLGDHDANDGSTDPRKRRNSLPVWSPQDRYQACDQEVYPSLDQSVHQDSSSAPPPPLGPSDSNGSINAMNARNDQATTRAESEECDNSIPSLGGDPTGIEPKPEPVASRARHCPIYAGGAGPVKGPGQRPYREVSRSYQESQRRRRRTPDRSLTNPNRSGSKQQMARQEASIEVLEPMKVKQETAGQTPTGKVGKGGKGGAFEWLGYRYTGDSARAAAVGNAPYPRRGRTGFLGRAHQ